MSTLYDDWVMDHSQSPRHQGPIDNPTHETRLDNPLCGDRVTVRTRVADGIVQDIGFEARACAVCMASASWMCTVVLGEGVRDAHMAIEDALDAVHPEEIAPGPPFDRLLVLRNKRSRRRCASLPWEALQQALPPPEPHLIKGNP